MLLYNEKNYILLDDLAQQLNVTTRTLRNDFNQMKNLLGKDIVEVKRNKGVLIKKSLPEQDLIHLVLEKNQHQLFFSSTERKNIIIETLLDEQYPITIDLLKDKTLSSKSQTIKDIHLVEAFFNVHNIKLLKGTKKGITIKYTEYNWRNAFVDYITMRIDEFNFQLVLENLKKGKSITNLIDNNFISNYLNEKNTVYISNFIRFFEENNKMKFTDRGFLAIYLYICISLERIAKQKTIYENSVKISDFLDERFIDEWVAKIMRVLYQISHINIPYVEAYSYFAFMLSQKNFSKYGILSKNLEKNDYFTFKARNITEHYLEKIGMILNIDLLDDQDLFNNLLLHIKPAIIRLLFFVSTHNELTEKIKERYNTIFNACLLASDIFERDLGVKVNDDEIAYITVHIGAMIEKKKVSHFSGILKVVIVCPEGIGTSTILYYRLLNNVPNIQIEGEYSIDDLQKANLENIDFIISTTNLSFESDCNVVCVNPLLYEEDVEKIRRLIKRINITKKGGGHFIVDDIMTIVSEFAIINQYDSLRSKLDNYFNHKIIDYKSRKRLLDLTDENLIKLNSEASSWDIAFKEAGTLLYEQNCIEKRYIQHTIDNVYKFGDYMMLNEFIAFPHAKAEDGALKTAFSFLTLKKPIFFKIEDREYQIKLVIALSSIDKESQQEAMLQILEIINNEDIFDRLINCKSKKEFIYCLDSIYSV